MPVPRLGIASATDSHENNPLERWQREAGMD